MEKFPKQESVEDVDKEVEGLLEEEADLFSRYAEKVGEISEDMDEREYYIVMEARTGADRIQARQRLKEFIDFLKNEIGEGEQE